MVQEGKGKAGLVLGLEDSELPKSVEKEDITHCWKLSFKNYKCIFLSKTQNLIFCYPGINGPNGKYTSV